MSRAERKLLGSLIDLAEITVLVKEPELGRNVVAARNIDAGALLGVYPGVKLRRLDYFEKHELIEKAIKCGYQLNDETIIDPTDIFGYLPDTPKLRIAMINEAPPGERLNVISLASKNNVWYLAIRKISAGEPLYTFYGSSYRRDYLSSVSELVPELEFEEDEIEVLRNAARSFSWLREDIGVLLKGIGECRGEQV